ncbi:MAG: hypothetical protein SF069_16485 [Phycisphaerae bacterium]|nr:hypothetical protein [Phycisphaerae bacterium]
MKNAECRRGVAFCTGEHAGGGLRVVMMAEAVLDWCIEAMIGGPGRIAFG